MELPVQEALDVPKSRMHPRRLHFGGFLPALFCAETREGKGKAANRRKISERRRDEVDQGDSCITINEYYASSRDLSCRDLI